MSAAETLAEMQRLEQVFVDTAFAESKLPTHWEPAVKQMVRDCFRAGFQAGLTVAEAGQNQQ